MGFVTIHAAPGCGAAVEEEELFSCPSEAVARALDTDRWASPVSVRALAGAVADSARALADGIDEPYVIRTPAEAGQVLDRVEAAALELGTCLQKLANWIDRNEPGFDTSALRSRGGALREFGLQDVGEALGACDRTELSLPTTSGEVARAIAHHLGRLGYRAADVLDGDEDPSCPTQMRVPLRDGQVLHIMEGFCGWESFIMDESQEPPVTCGQDVSIGADHDPRRIAELSLEGLGLTFDPPLSGTATLPPLVPKGTVR
ncbi:hypothetical protein [Streptomyces sp. NPDC094049]|uniref:hypothetical protein n=1 Tax=Streptomyces sp. NPDC094049 TaxID=3154987 RepID=UPI00332F7352